MRNAALPFLAARRRGTITPLQIPGLGFWHRADATLASVGPDIAAVHGDAIRRWTDLSGNGRHFDQSTAGFRAVLAAGGIAGRPAASFDGVDDRYDITSGLGILNNVAGATLVLVDKLTSATVSATLGGLYISNGIAATSSRAHLGQRASNTLSIQGRRLDGDAATTTAGGTTTTNPTVLVGRIQYSLAISELFVNGVFAGTTNPFLAPGNTSATDSLAINLGAINTISFYPGLRSEAILWPRALTDAELRQLHNSYLAPRYSLPRI